MADKKEPKEPKKKRAPKQAKLPGTARTDVHADIEKAAAAYVEIRDERMEMTKQETKAQAALLIAMKAHGLTHYRCDGEELEVQLIPESEKAKVRKVAPPSDDTSDDDTDE